MKIYRNIRFHRQSSPLGFPQQKIPRKKMSGGLALLLGVMILAGCQNRPTATDTGTVTPPQMVVPTVAHQTIEPTAQAIPEATADMPAAPFQPENVRLSLTPVITGLDQPVFVTHAGDGSGRLFIVERRGLIWVYDQGGTTEAQPFLDIRDRVSAAGQEQGLLGLAFDPVFAQTGAFFVNYTDGRGDTTLSRFQLMADASGQADPGSEQILLTIDQPASNHNGGMLTFGPDGMLYMGTGDGGAANDRYGNGQNPATLLGKMLRLDVTSKPGSYVIPADNPWLAQDWNGQDMRDEVWAVGLRNPWRYSFDRLTGDLWIGDVGQNVYEEIDFVAAGSAGGLNFGWPIMEGTHCFPDSANCDSAGLEIPVADYRHGADGCSVTGGYVYRGAQVPVLNGVYLYSDYCSGNIWAIHPAESGSGWQNSLLTKAQATVSSFGEDEAGEIYVTDLAKGTVFRLGTE